MGKISVGSGPVKVIPPTIIEKIVEVPVIVEKIVEVPKEVIVERLIETIKEVPKMMVEYKTVEVPVMFEKIVEVPVEKIVIKEVMPRVVDITDTLEVKKQSRTIRRLKAALVLSLITNLIILLVK